MSKEQIPPAPSESIKTRRELAALLKRIHRIHTLRNVINQGLSRIRESNLSLALTQKKNLRDLRNEYDKLTGEVHCLPPLDAASILEEEYNYILTIGNIMETTRELKKGVKIGENNRRAIISGLVQFYDGLRREMDEAEANPQGGIRP